MHANGTQIKSGQGSPAALPQMVMAMSPEGMMGAVNASRPLHRKAEGSMPVVAKNRSAPRCGARWRVGLIAR